MIALAVAGVSACNSGEAPPTSGASGLVAEFSEGAASLGNPVLHMPAAGSNAASFLDPDAQPRTALGALRARWLPVWSDEFDTGFPPALCDSAWELDAIAVPEAAPVGNGVTGGDSSGVYGGDYGGDTSMMGDFATAAALAVMRFEYQLSRALHEPSATGQLCVAAASIDPVRTESLQALAAHLANGNRSTEPPSYPEDVVLVAASPTDVVAVTCVASGGSAADISEGGGFPATEMPDPMARMSAYLLGVARGIEDAVVDVTYRVSQRTGEIVDDCSGFDSWVDEWNIAVQRWLAEGQVWETLNLSLNADEICESPLPQGPHDCPRDWPL